MTTLTKAPPRKRRSLIADIERELRAGGIPYVSVDEAKKALFQNTKLRSFHFVVYSKEGDNWLLWCGQPSTAVRQDMTQWAQVFGEGFQVVYAVRHTSGIVYKTSAGTPLTLNGVAPIRNSTTLFPDFPCVRKVAVQ